MLLANSYIQLCAIGIENQAIYEASNGYAVDLLKFARIWIGLP